MKKITSFILISMLASLSLRANTNLNVINATINYTLYFNTVSKTSSCYPEIREYYPSGPSGYCTVAAGVSIAFSDFNTMNTYFPGLTFTRKLSSGASPTTLSLTLANTYLTSLSMNWAYVIYKVTHNTTGHTEGVWLGFSDFSACHSLPDSWGTYGTTLTESFTTFTIGSDRYFVVGEY